MRDNEYLPVEKVRLMQEPVPSQKDFAQMIGCSWRTYTGRLGGTQPNWLLSEVIEASKLNYGKIIINIKGTNYKIHIEECD